MKCRPPRDATAISHPATFSAPIMEVLRQVTPKGPVLDPFGGVGTLGRLGAGWEVTSNEIVPEWAAQGWENGCTVVVIGDARYLPFKDDSIPTLVTSPAYGNRLADQRASRTQGTADETRADRSRRTYAGFLGRRLCERNGAGMQWGRRYREFHARACAEMVRVLAPGGWLILNIKDHIRDHDEQGVPAWWCKTVRDLGLIGPDPNIDIDMSGDQNISRRRASGRPTVDFELVWVFRKPATTGAQESR